MPKSTASAKDVSGLLDIYFDISIGKAVKDAESCSDINAMRDMISEEISSLLQQGCTVPEMVASLKKSSLAPDAQKEIIRLAVEKSIQALFLKPSTVPVEHSTDVFVPAPQGATFSPAGKGGVMKAPAIIPRLQYLLEVLDDLANEFNLNPSTMKIIEGAVSSDMVRKTPYFTVVIPALDRIVLVCDEANNRTYVIFGHVNNPEKIYSLTKNELALMVGNSQAVCFTWTDQADWKNKIRNALTSTPLTLKNAPKTIPSLPKGLPQAGLGGVLMIGGKEYRTKGNLGNILQCSAKTLHAIITANGIAPIRGKYKGKALDFYEKDAVEKHIPPFADTAGVLMVHGKAFRPIAALATELGATPDAIGKIIKDNGLLPVKGRIGKLWCDFYDTDRIKSLMPSIPKADSRGIMVVGGKSFSTIHGMQGILKQDRNVISDAIDKAGLASIKGRAGNNVHDFFEIDAVRALCPAIPQADRTGAITVGGKEFRTQRGLENVLRISRHRIREILGKTMIPSVIGQYPGGSRRPYTFYNRDEIGRELSKV